MPQGRPLPGWAGALLLMALAVALRAADFGSPIIHADEQYYLLIGQRMLDGALPYVDIWSREPVGLFLLYAGAAALPGDDIRGYQLVATVFAGLTAIVVASGARALGASRAGAFAAGVAYLIWLPLLGGRGGQSPVFYNPPIAVAARCALRLPGLRTRRSIVVNGAVVCLSAGIAIQLKSTTVVEAAFLGLAHLWWLRRNGGGIAAIGGAAVLWCAVALVPTLAAMFSYRAIGPAALDAWWFANVATIVLRPSYPTGEVAMRLLGIVAQLSPLLLCAGIAWRRRRVRLSAERAIAFGWLAAAVVGFGIVGMISDHYALPLLPPLAMVAGIALGRIPRVAVGTLVLGLLLMVVERAFIGHDAAGARAVAQVVQANSRGGCPYVFSGDAATYSLAQACLPTSRAFPPYLSMQAEADATGVDAVAEVRRILADRPPVIVASTHRMPSWNADTLALMNPALATGYRAVFSTRRSRARTVVFLRNDLSFIPR